LPSGTLLDWFSEYGQRSGIAKLGAFETAITNYNMIKITMLEYDFRSTNFDAVAAIGAFVFQDNIGAVVPTNDGIFGASLLTLAALRANLRFKLTRLRKFGLDAQACLLRIYLLIMGYGANLHTQTAAAALTRNHSQSF
jgi:hypothetical protein